MNVSESYAQDPTATVFTVITIILAAVTSCLALLG